MSCISAPDGLIRTGRGHGNVMMDETAIQLRLDRASNPGPSGWNSDKGTGYTYIIQKWTHLNYYKNLLTEYKWNEYH